MLRAVGLCHEYVLSQSERVNQQLKIGAARTADDARREAIAAASYEERQAGSQTGPLYAISFTVILLCLAALYESWPIPISVMLVVPLGVIGAIVATWMRGLDNDVYFQVGLLTTVGLATKNAS